MDANKQKRATPQVSERLANLKKIGSRLFGPFTNMAGLRVQTGSSLEQRLRRVEEELAVRDAFGRYHYYYDAGEIEGILTVFADDCVVVNPRGTYIGKEQIRQNYAFLLKGRGPIFHYATNVMVRVEEDFETAWLTAFFLACSATDGSRENGIFTTVNNAGGTYANHLKKRDGEWQIVEQRITANFSVGRPLPELRDLRDAPEGRRPPPPDIEESSVNWLETDPYLAWPSGRSESSPAGVKGQ